MPSLKQTLKLKLLSASAKALKICNTFANNSISFVNLHKISKRGTPDQMIQYKLAICLFKLYNNNFNSIEFAALNYNQILTSRQTKFITSKDNKTKVGMNSLSNRLFYINWLVPLEWLNLSIGGYIVKCKELFLNEP